MSVPARLAAFAVVLALVLGGAALAGSAVNPTDDHSAPAAAGHGAEEHAAGGEHGGEGHGGAEHGGAGDAASGLAVSEDGFGLEVERTRFTAGERAPLRFRITDPRGRVVRDAFELEHDRELHLIVVRRDTAGFQHLHPRRDRAGTWEIGLDLPAAGVYRMYADFTIDGEQRTLATDLFVPGAFEPRPLPAPAPTDRTGDLAVALAAPGLRAGRETRLTFSVTAGGRPFARLQPYLGAKGHLVALREGDLAYLHVHPTEGAAAHEVPFAATFPTPGRYRLFLQVRAAGDVRTVAYTVTVPR
jgi:hypothetical protein